MLQCGLLGRTLKHSYSPAIHKAFGGYNYALYEKEEQDVEAFMHSTSWDGLNVTIPYKKTVFPYLTDVSDTARKAGSVNTVVRRPNGDLFGDNTDVYGFAQTVLRSGIAVKDKKTLVLGNGGAAAAVLTALEDMGARTVVISRSGENHYGNLDRHADAEIIVNTTPLGMYPDTGRSAVDLAMFPRCRGVFDVIYNPARTALLLQAESLGIPCENGLYMLVAQAKRSAELFSGRAISDAETERVFDELRFSMQNIVLIGMPGCGKSTIAAELARATGRQVWDSDEEIARRTGKKPSQIITEQGESVFRDIECAVLADLGKQSGIILATGGGAVLREENHASLHQNGTVIWLRRDIATLPCEGRPLSQQNGAEALYAVREPLYRRFADATAEVVPEDGVSANAAKVLRAVRGQR